MKLIFGSGIVGVMARYILGDDWTIIPFGKSRFYSYNPPLDDNFIIHDRQLDPLMVDLGLLTTPIWLQRAYSIGGELIRKDPDGSLAKDWLNKIFGSEYPPHAEAYLSARMGFFVYDQVRINQLYRILQQRYRQELLREWALGPVTEIGDHYIVRNGIKQDYEKAVNTIPLNVLLGLMGMSSRHQLQYKSSHSIHMETSFLNFEGATQVMVVDPIFDFYKVTILAKNRYLFHLHQEVKNAGAYFMPIIADFDLIDGTQIPESLPLGMMPSLGWLEQLDIFPVGAYAQHDWCADVGSNFLRLLKYSGRGDKPHGLQLILPTR